MGWRPDARFLPGALAIAVLAVYWPGLAGGFAFDDYQVIVANRTLAPASWSLAALLDALTSAAHTGPLGRPLAMFSFALNRALSGADAFGFKFVNLCIHALNALLVYAVLKLLIPHLRGGLPNSQRVDTDRVAHRLALFTAACWALHPLNVTSVLYVVQRMTTLSAGGVLIALWIHLDAHARRHAGRPPRRCAGAAFVAAALAAVLCKETALSLPLYVLVIEYWLCTAAARRRMAIRLVLLLGVLGIVATAPWWAERLAHLYHHRPFTLGERLLTEARVLASYLGLVFAPHPAAFALFHDDIEVSRSFYQPLTTLPAVGLIGALFASARMRRWPALPFACYWFVAGHALESSLYPLELMHEHRNYLPMLGPLCAAVLAAEHVLRARARPRAGAVLAAVILAALVVQTALRAFEWRDPMRQMEAELLRHPRSARAWYEVGRLRIEQTRNVPARRADGMAALERARELAEWPILPLAALLKLAIERDEHLAQERLIDAVARHSPRVALGVIHDVVNCQSQGICAPAPKAVANLIGRVLGSPAMPDLYRALVLERLAFYYLTVLRDGAAARAVLEDGAALRPADRKLRLLHAEAVFIAGTRVEARRLATTLFNELPWHAAWSARSERARLTRLLVASDAP
jgi:hypothetical protein